MGAYSLSLTYCNYNVVRALLFPFLSPVFPKFLTEMVFILIPIFYMWMGPEPRVGAYLLGILAGWVHRGRHWALRCPVHVFGVFWSGVFHYPSITSLPYDISAIVKCPDYFFLRQGFPVVPAGLERFSSPNTFITTIFIFSNLTTNQKNPWNWLRLKTINNTIITSWC